MDLKNIGGIVAGFVIAVVLLSSVLVPIISSSLITAGDVTTINNENTAPTADYTDSDFTMSLYVNADEAGNSIYVNSVGYVKPAVTKVALMTDRLFVYASSTAGRTAEIRYWSDIDTQVSTNIASDITITYNHNTRVLTYSSTSLDLTFNDVSFVFVWDENGQYGEILNINQYPAKVFRMESINDNTWGIFDYAGTITLGDVSHKCIISASAYGVISYFEDNPDWTVTLNKGTPTLKEGTTDLYTGLQPKFVISDGENSTEVDPFRAFVLNEASGHADSGAVYDLLSIIPLLVTVGILMGIVTAVFVRRE